MPFASPIIRPVVGGGVEEPVLDPHGNVHGNSSDLIDERSGWDKFVDGLRTYFGFGSGGPAAGNSQGGTHIGTNVPGAGSSDPLTPEQAETVFDFLEGNNNASTSGKGVGEISLDSILGSSAQDVDPVLQSYYNMYAATGNTAYLDKLLDYNASLSSINSAREWEKMMSDTSFSRLVDDIQNKGYNPWLALQSGVSSAAAYNTSSASVGSGTPTSSAVSAANNERSVSAEITGSVIRALTMIALIAFTRGAGKVASKFIR